MTYYPLDLKGNQLTSKNVKFDMDGIVIYNGKIKGTIESVNNSILLPGNGIIWTRNTPLLLQKILPRRLLTKPAGLATRI